VLASLSELHFFTQSPPETKRMPIANEVYVHEARGWRKLPHEVVMATTFEIGGLSGLDQEELQELLHEKVQFEEPSVPEGTLAEPATIAAIVTLGSGVLFAFATWLSKRRRSYLWQQTIRIHHPDGRVEEQSLTVKAASEDEVKAQVLQQLGQMLPHPSAVPGTSGPT
jgi:hypothetical protein